MCCQVLQQNLRFARELSKQQVCISHRPKNLQGLPGNHGLIGVTPSPHQGFESLQRLSRRTWHLNPVYAESFSSADIKVPQTQPEARGRSVNNTARPLDIRLDQEPEGMRVTSTWDSLTHLVCILCIIRISLQEAQILISTSRLKGCSRL